MVSNVLVWRSGQSVRLGIERSGVRNSPVPSGFSLRIYRLGVSQAQKAKVSGDERFIAFAPNFPFFLFLWSLNALEG